MNNKILKLFMFFISLFHLDNLRSKKLIKNKYIYMTNIIKIKSLYAIFNNNASNILDNIFIYK